MKTGTKVIIDEWIGRFVVVLLNVAARILGKILRIDHSLKKKPERIAVCKFLGMGSIIQATPLLQTLRLNFPDAEIVFITSKGNASLINSIDVVNRSVLIDDSSLLKVITSTLSAMFGFWKRRIDLYLDLETYSYYSTALATVSCATNRFGFYRVERNIRMGVHTHMMFFNQRAPISQSYLQMARSVGCKEIVEKLFRFKTDQSIEKSAIDKYPFISSDRYLVINPNASDLRTERRWPAEKYIALAKKLLTSFPDVKLFFIGNKAEKDYVGKITSQLSNVEDTSGQLSLKELFVLIEKSSLVITNDTGPMHISYAFEKPTVSLFGPASPLQYGQNKFAYGIYKNVYCSPCVHDFLVPPCGGDNQCMKQISVDEVYNLVANLLSGKAPDNLISPLHYLNGKSDQALGKISRI